MGDRAAAPPAVADATLEAEVQRIGRELADAFPGPARHPVRSLDKRAMQLTTEDARLGAAIFRLVDVTPACRSLDDLAAHLVGYLRDVPERPPSLDVAMKMAGNAAGRKALGAATAAGVRHMAHRFIVGESPRAALDTISALWRGGIAASVDLLGEATVTTAEADRYAERCDEALVELSRGGGRLAASASGSNGTRPGRSRGSTSR